MSDWQVGDLALCVNAGEFEGKTTPELTEGAAYTVIRTKTWPGGVGLHLAEVEPQDGFLDFAAERFRKIRPDKHEPCEEEFVTLLKRKRVSA